VVAAPTFLHLASVAATLRPDWATAAQDAHPGGPGAFTGQVPAEAVADAGAAWVIVGHSERRGEFGLPTPAESNALLATKLAYILEKGLNCIFCIGEPLPIREQGFDAVMAECRTQLNDILPSLRALEDHSRVVIAYEPVWAIGTGVTASPMQAQETHAGIRQYLASAVSPQLAANIRIQYGGSANAANAPELSAQPDIDGFLVGGASLKPEFAQIVAAIAAAKASARF
jgi:triosephosphate isomerase